MAGKVHMAGLALDVTDAEVEDGIYSLLSDVCEEALAESNDPDRDAAALLGSGETLPFVEVVDTYGGLCSTQLIRHKDTGLCKGYGFIAFYTVAQAEAAAAKLTGATVAGCQLTVTVTRPPPNWGKIKPRTSEDHTQTGHIPLCPRKKGKSKPKHEKGFTQCRHAKES